ncbi:MAG: HRDC domain-containing protein [Pirellulaceae bacterium]
MFVDGERTVIVHAGREEILFAYRSTGQSISRLFDVQLALGLLGGEFPASYGKLLQRILGETVAKGETRTDWRRRPLSSAQLDYAALDVLHLPQLYDALSSELAKLGRLQWLEDELLRRQASLIETQVQEGWHRMSGIQSLYGKQLGIVRELWTWRDQRAEQKNMPARRVLRDDLIIELAKRGSSDAKKLHTSAAYTTLASSDSFPKLQTAWPAACTPTPRSPWQGQGKRPRPPAILQQFLTAAMSYLCRTHNISPTIVGTSDDVGKLASYWMSGEELKSTDPDYPHLLRGWRGELVGHPLYHIYSGKRALRVKDPQDEMPLSLCDVESES